MIERHAISRSQFCDLLGLEPAALIGVEGVGASSATFTLVLESDDADHRHISATDHQHAATAAEGQVMAKKTSSTTKMGGKRGGKGCNY